MRHTKSYLQTTDTSYGVVTCQADVFVAADQSVVILLSQRDLGQPILNPYPEIATAIHAREGFKLREKIIWYHDCAVRVSPPTLWEMNLLLISEGWPWKKAYRWEEAGLSRAMMDRAPFFRRLGVADPLVAVQANAEHDELQKQGLAAILYGHGGTRGWFDSQPTEPMAMRGLLLLFDDRLDEIAETIGSGEWTFLVQMHGPFGEAPEKTLHRASSILSAHARMLAACEQAKQRLGVKVSFALISEEWRLKMYPDMPIELVG